MSKALLLIDIQNDYFANGRMELQNSLIAAKHARDILMWFRNRENPVFHIQHLSIQPGAAFFLPGTVGAEIHQSVLPLKHEEVIIKHFPNSFYETELMHKLKEKEVDELVVAGMMTHMCVDATIRAAKDIGFKCSLIEDACATRELVYQKHIIPPEHVHFSFIHALNGYYSTVYTAQEFMEKN